MPSAGFVIGASVWLSGSAGHGFTGRPPLVAGRPRLSHATIALTRGSFCPMNETPAAPNECPASPICCVLSIYQNGLYAAFKPAATRRFCLGA